MPSILTLEMTLPTRPSLFPWWTSRRRRSLNLILHRHFPRNDVVTFSQFANNDLSQRCVAVICNPEGNLYGLHRVVGAELPYNGSLAWFGSDFFLKCRHLLLR